MRRRDQHHLPARSERRLLVTDNVSHALTRPKMRSTEVYRNVPHDVERALQGEQRAPRALLGGALMLLGSFRDEALVAHLAQNLMIAEADVVVSGGAQRPAVVFDIDDTILHLSEDESRFVGNECARALYEAAVANNILIFFITARSDADGALEWTEQQLDDLGCGAYHALELRPAYVGSSGREVAHFKHRARDMLASKHNARIILNAGDQWTDHLSDMDDDDIEQLYAKGPSGRNYVLFRTPVASAASSGLHLKMPHNVRARAR